MTATGTSPSRSDTGQASRPAGCLRAWRAPAAAACLFLAVHLAYLAPTLDDIDAVNFAFGVRQFDPAKHQPHPPGYPVYIALGKLSTPVVDALWPATRLAPLRRDNAALALAFWSAIFGAAALLACWAVFTRVEALEEDRAGPPVERGELRVNVAAWAAILAAFAPLAWFTASRPMSDVPGLAAALAAQALLLEAWRRDRKPGGVHHTGRPGSVRHGERTGSRDWVRAAGLRAILGDPLTLGAFLAAVALGIRSQVLWLTLPLLAAVLVARGRRRGVLAALPGASAYAMGAAAWAIPMVAVTGWPRYLEALGGQGAEDFSGVDMLWTHFGVRRLAIGLWQTFILPWSSAPLAAVVLLAAAGGVVVMWRRARLSLTCLALLAAPYAVYHLLFHETVTTRYALPLVPVVTYLAVRASAAAGSRVAAAQLLLVLGGSLAIGLPAMGAYAATPSPIFQALGALDTRGPQADAGPVLGLHRSAKPALDWAVDAAPWLQRLSSPQHHEWAKAVAVLRGEPSRPVWFLADRSRRGEFRFRDLALVDPRGVRSVGEFHWNVAAGLLSGVRPDSVDLYEIRAPGWIAGEGWALTPETAGMADKARRGPAYGPIEALIRRRADSTLLLVGGRHLGGRAQGAARVDIRVDGRPAATFVVDPEPQFFLKVLTLSPGVLAGPGSFATMTLAAAPADGAARPVHLAIEQFDADGAAGVVAGYETGWQESEYDPSRQQQWRWMSERATLLIRAGGRGPLTLRLTAESPRRYFERPSEVKVRVGADVLWRMTPDARLPRLLARLAGAGTFSATVRIDREALARASDRVTIEADQFFVPASRDQNADRRHLALRVLDVQVHQDR